MPVKLFPLTFIQKLLFSCAQRNENCYIHIKIENDVAAFKFVQNRLEDFESNPNFKADTSFNFTFDTFE